MKFSWLVFLMGAFLLPSTALASGPLPAPVLVKGQYVYTIPVDFDPPLVKRAGLEDLNNAVKALHFPYYIVVIQDLPGSGDEAARMHAATDGLAADWTEAGGFDPSLSQVIVLSYNPRKLGLLAGGKFKSELGFERDAHQPYHEIFKRSITGTPKDPKGGIIAMTKAIDDYLFDQTDPTLIAARKEAARAEAERQAAAERAAQAERVMQNARAELSNQIQRLQGLLDQKEDLPEDASSYAELLVKAKEVRSTDEPESMVQFAGSMKPTVDVLDATVTGHKNAEMTLSAQIDRMTTLLAKKDSLPKNVSAYESALKTSKDVLGVSHTVPMNESTQVLKTSADKLAVEIDAIETAQAHEAFMRFVKWTMLILSLLGAIAFYLFRRMEFLRLQKQWRALVETWNERITNATTRYVDFYTDRDKCSRLEEATGKTRDLYASVTSSVDEIFALVQAMGVNLGKYQLIAAKATLFNTKPLVQAIAELESTFKFDTGQLNQADLFGNQTKILDVNPDQVMKDLQKKFEGTVEGWNKLKAASEVLFYTVREVFSHAKLDELFELVHQHKIPERWLRMHPLFGDDASDVKFWEELTTLRNSDPIAFLERVEKEQEAEAVLESHVHELVRAVENAHSNRIEQSPDTIGVVCDPDDDPMITFQSARQEEDRLAGLLASGDHVSEIQEQATKIVALYKKCAHQTATLASAKTGAEEAFVRMHASREKAIKIAPSAKDTVMSASKVHSNVSSAEVQLHAATDFLAEADRVLEKAMRQQSEKRFLNARITAEKALSAFDKVTDAYKQAIHICEDLDQKKRAFESQLARMDSNRQAAEQKIAGYGRSSSLTYRAPKFDSTSALDYIILQRQLDEQQALWDREARAAQHAHEAELERQRQLRAAEARRQRELQEAAEAAARAKRRRRQEAADAAEEAAAAARRSSYSHSSSSSYGSSYGGSSSSSSSWSGSDSSSSSSSWSDSSSSSSSSSTDW
ncbi:hypothetical protein A2318_04095 [Candidatus Uhrbacteria bacterium RIFOXYB2_FULL_45_11]|uniref:TPM domain-containing protein n=1 Tax=Candidatus Uhrbacteria bacterium RIFOXYB2_FULL_45_11 TaxID=1802421 RepID=A0A1F7W1Z3_9BACT|nr:MAG: hypothetical protein A2318_04095 [Candidatus Uhrbacteria bacterium RIFOXYB2_FULL_45_11]